MSFQNPIRFRETACNSAEEEETHHPPSDGYTPVRGAGDLPSDVHTLERRGRDPPSDGNTLVERTPSNQHDDLGEVITPRRENLMMLLKTNLYVYKQYHLAMVEAVEPFKMHPTSISYLYEVFEHLQLLRMGLCLHTHTVTTTDVSPDLGELAESLGDARVQTIPLRNG